MISLKDHAPKRMASILIELLSLIEQNIDSAMLFLNQDKILLALDMLVTVTEFIREQTKLGGQLENKVPENDPKKHLKTLTNLLRK